jgi:fructose-1-phosphate kinase PfkB-like protein
MEEVNDAKNCKGGAEIVVVSLGPQGAVLNQRFV